MASFFFTVVMFYYAFCAMGLPSEAFFTDAVEVGDNVPNHRKSRNNHCCKISLVVWRLTTLVGFKGERVT
eukprot:5906019-Amphidinium_carterae.1